ncbi:MAG TPA: hypothetical protein VK723_00340 [Thermoplasmata archaeon]|nr:hypothetical protein [Thermoplasmata archaeon]
MYGKLGVVVALVVALFGATVLANVASAKASDRAAGRIYGDDVLWATFVPTTLHPGPEQSFNKLYSFPGTDLISVTNSLPRDSDYRGGRWQVYAVTFEGTSATQFTNDAQVLAAAAAGQVSISASPVAYVLCPLFTL